MFVSTAFENGTNTNKFIYTNKLILFESLSTKPINMQVYIKYISKKVNINTVIRSKPIDSKYCVSGHNSYQLHY